MHGQAALPAASGPPPARPPRPPGCSGARKRCTPTTSTVASHTAASAAAASTAAAACSEPSVPTTIRLRTGSPGAARRGGQSRSRRARPGSSAPLAKCFSRGRMRAAVKSNRPEDARLTRQPRRRKREPVGRRSARSDVVRGGRLSQQAETLAHRDKRWSRRGVAMPRSARSALPRLPALGVVITVRWWCRTAEELIRELAEVPAPEPSPNASASSPTPPSGSVAAPR